MRHHLGHKCLRPTVALESFTGVPFRIFRTASPVLAVYGMHVNGNTAEPCRPPLRASNSLSRSEYMGVPPLNLFLFLIPSPTIVKLRWVAGRAANQTEPRPSLVNPCLLPEFAGQQPRYRVYDAPTIFRRCVMPKGADSLVGRSACPFAQNVDRPLGFCSARGVRFKHIAKKPGSKERK